jgi:hypothetical protein
MFSILNSTRLAVMQVGVIVIGVLASGLWRRAAIGNGTVMPPAAGLLYHYGVAGLLVPLAWLIVALLVLRSPAIRDGVKALAFILGIGLLIGLILFVLYADVSPLFGIQWHLNRDDDLSD